MRSAVQSSESEHSDSRYPSAAVSHALLTGPANERLDASPIRQLLTTDSVETQPAGLSAKVEVVSVGGLFAEAIRRIAARESVSVLFR